MNLFRLNGDLAHFASKCILIWSIHRNKSAEGISLLTQGMYMVVFVTRYLDLANPMISIYNTSMKIFYILSSFYIVFLMLRNYPYTHESVKAWQVTVVSVTASFVLSIPFNYAGLPISTPNSVMELFWSFSIFLESVCAIPQLIILRQTTVPTVINSPYLLALGFYRGFYILNWIYRYFDEGNVDPIAVVGGVVQTALYADFAWVYYSRQRVKLRNGAIVGSDNVTRSWFFRPIDDKESSKLEAGGDDILDARPVERHRQGATALPGDAAEGTGLRANLQPPESV